MHISSIKDLFNQMFEEKLFPKYHLNPIWTISNAKAIIHVTRNDNLNKILTQTVCLLGKLYVNDISVWFKKKIGSLNNIKCSWSHVNIKDL